MATLFVRHEVEDFGTWKKAYDDFNAERATMGVTDHGVYQTEGSPNDVTVFHDFKTPEAARAFMDSPRLREIMTAAGVKGQPSVWITEKA
jgi:hypothetical protein